MNDEMPHDDQLRALYRKLPADEPRAQLDDAILAAARKRARETARLHVLRRVRWSVSLAAAAGLVLTLTLNRPTFDPDLKRANDSPVQLSEFAQPVGAPPPATAPALTTNPATLDALEDHDARREDTPAAAAPSKKAAPEESNDRKQEAQPLAKDAEAGRARLKGDGASPLAKPKSEKPTVPEAKASASRPFAGSGGATTPSSNEGRTGHPAPKSPPVDVLSSLQSLGYIRGGDEAAAPAPPPPGGAAEKDAAKSSDVVRRNAPAAPEVDNAPSKGGKESFGENQRPHAEEPPDAADRALGASSATNDDVAACEAAPAQPPASLEPWPFGLEPGLTPEEACRRVREALGGDCRFRAGLVDIPLVPAARIDRGRFAGRSASHLTMSLQRDKLWSVLLGFTAPDGSFTQESLIAPDPVWPTTPTPAPTPKD